MSKFFCAQIRIPENPRVRFFVPDPSESFKFKDVTFNVAKLCIEELENSDGQCDLIRFDKDDKLVWKTRHPSLQDSKWHAEFEYGLPEDKWTKTPNIVSV